MSKISISKKTAWSLILKINSKISCKNNLVNINAVSYTHLTLPTSSVV